MADVVVFCCCFCCVAVIPSCYISIRRPLFTVSAILCALMCILIGISSVPMPLVAVVSHIRHASHLKASISTLQKCYCCFRSFWNELCSFTQCIRAFFAWYVSNKIFWITEIGVHIWHQNSSVSLFCVVLCSRSNVKTEIVVDYFDLNFTIFVMRRTHELYLSCLRLWDWTWNDLFGELLWTVRIYRNWSQCGLWRGC